MTMNMTDGLSQKVEATRRLIADQLAIRRKPVVAWSSGKDSQVSLYLVREQDPNVEVIYLPGFPHPTKHAFAERIAREWRLNLHAPLPRTRDAISKNGHVELVELYELSRDRWLYFPIEAEPGHGPTKDSHCGFALLAGGETYDQPMDYGAVFIGHRDDDRDPTHGDVPLTDYVVDAGDLAYIYPLRDWTEADIWAASESLGIPQNDARYHNGDMSANADYHELCTNCFLAAATCPKTGGPTTALFNESELEAKREQYRAAFANIG